MSVQINYKDSSSKLTSVNIVLFSDEKFNISNCKKYITSSEFSFISDLIKSKNLKHKIITFDINSRKKILLVSLKKHN